MALPPGMHAQPRQVLRDAVNELALRTLLECILLKKFLSLVNANIKLDSL